MMSKKHKTSQPSHSVVSKHHLTKNHEFNCNQLQILHREEHVRKREIVKMFFIKRNSNAINLQKGT